MSTSVPPVTTGSTFELVVSGHPALAFAELGGIRNEVTNPKGVLAGRPPKQLGVVTLRNAPWTPQLLWLENWYEAAQLHKPHSRMNFSLLVASAQRTVVRCNATGGRPTQLVRESVAGQEILEQLTLHCATLVVEYV